VVSGAVGVFLEPLVDVAGLAWYPPEAGWSYAQTAGITLPGLTLPGYTWIYGAFAGCPQLRLSASEQGANRE